MAESKKTAPKKVAKKAEVVAETAPVTEAKDEKAKEEPKIEVEVKAVAKAGKRSSKSIKESEEKQAKQERKTSLETEPTKAKQVAKPPRSRIERAGKKYRELAKQVDKTKACSLNEALELATKTNPAKFDASVELHINLGIDPKQADQNLRGNLVLPAGSGKQVRVAVLAEADEAKRATAAGADIAASDSLLAQLEKEEINFDILITSPAMMAKLGKYARLLGPRGLMPNPKSGTVTNDISKAVKESKAGRIEYRTDSFGIVHLSVGKVSFGSQKLAENTKAVIDNIRAAKPASLKGNYIKSVYVSSTMGPSIKVELSTNN